MITFPKKSITITLTFSAPDYRLLSITYKNVIDYNQLQLQIVIAPGLVFMQLCFAVWNAWSVRK